MSTYEVGKNLLHQHVTVSSVDESPNQEELIPHASQALTDCLENRRFALDHIETHSGLPEHLHDLVKRRIQADTDILIELSNVITDESIFDLYYQQNEAYESWLESVLTDFTEQPTPRDKVAERSEVTVVEVPNTKSTTKGIDVDDITSHFVQLEREYGVFDKIDLQLIVGSGGAVLSHLLPADARPVKDLDLITFVHGEEARAKMFVITNDNSRRLSICNETNEVYDSTAFFPDSNISLSSLLNDNLTDILPWARPHVLKVSELFLNSTLRPVAGIVLPEAAVESFEVDYLLTAAGIAAKLDKDFRLLRIDKIKDIVDTATQYRLDYYLGKHQDRQVKTNFTIPIELARILYKEHKLARK